jgi:hypothetical protein
MKGKQEVQGQEQKARTPVQITVSVEPTTPCVTNTPERTPTFRQPNFSGRGATGQGSNQGQSTRGESSGSNSQLSTPHGGSSSTQFKMAGQDPTSDYQSFRERHQRTLKIIYSSVKISGKKRRSQMRIQNSHS